MMLGSPRVLTIALVFSVLGCATFTREPNQNIGLTAPGCTEPVQCTFTNKKGTWSAETPGMVSVRRSDDPLRVACKMGSELWSETIKGQRGGRAWGNAIIGGGIGAIVDANTDAHWDYPAAISIQICN